MKNTFLFVSCMFLSAALAGPQILPDVKLSQDQNRRVTVAYELVGGPAVVTVDIETNASDGVWLSIGAHALANVAGDVNRVVDAGKRTIIWKPHRDWTGNHAENARAVVTAWATNAPPDYMVVDLVEENCVRYYTSTNAFPLGGLTNDVYRTSKMVLKRVHATGVTYTMGGDKTVDPTYNGYAEETPHLVTLVRDYYLGIYEITRAQYSYVTGGGKSFYSAWWKEVDYADTAAADCLFLDDWRGEKGSGVCWPLTGYKVKAGSFFECLRKKTGIGYFDFPLEAEWEYACRAGTYTRFHDGKRGAMVADINKYAWTSFREDELTIHPVGKLEANGWGFYDMHGNVGEVCLDVAVVNASGGEGTPVVTADPRIDPIGDIPLEIENYPAVVRGGCYGDQNYMLGAAFRRGMSNTANNAIGGRVCLHLRPRKSFSAPHGE